MGGITMSQFKILTPVFIALPALLNAAALPAVAAESIVGVWSSTRACNEIDRIYIEPMGLGGEDWSCDFNSVGRKVNVVTWRGRCGSPDPEHDPDRHAATIVARLSGVKLYLSKNGESRARTCAARNELDS
jgi:hypothetical protein